MMFGCDSRAVARTSRSKRSRASGSFGPRVDELDGAGPLQQAVLGEVDFAHPTDPDQLAELVLIEPPGLEDLLAQSVEDVDREERQAGGHHRHRQVQAGQLVSPLLVQEPKDLGMQPGQRETVTAG